MRFLEIARMRAFLVLISMLNVGLCGEPCDRYAGWNKTVAVSVRNIRVRGGDQTGVAFEIDTRKWPHDMCIVEVPMPKRVRGKFHGMKLLKDGKEIDDPDFSYVTIYQGRDRFAKYEFLPGVVGKGPHPIHPEAMHIGVLGDRDVLWKTRLTVYWREVEP